MKIENGLMIKLYLPECEIDEFLRLFDLLFDYLEGLTFTFYFFFIIRWNKSKLMTNFNLGGIEKNA
jgi:hypothetical protein